jgi:prevent-host-death family protein
VTWKIAAAKQRFAEVIRAAQTEPQLILNRNSPVAVLVGPEHFVRLQALEKVNLAPTLAELTAELRRICAEEAYELEVPARFDRPNPFQS